VDGLDGWHNLDLEDDLASLYPYVHVVQAPPFALIVDLKSLLPSTRNPTLFETKNDRILVVFLFQEGTQGIEHVQEHPTHCIA
jgi:hypothetical protein